MTTQCLHEALARGSNESGNKFLSSPRRSVGRLPKRRSFFGLQQSQMIADLSTCLLMSVGGKATDEGDGLYENEDVYGEYSDTEFSAISMDQDGSSMQDKMLEFSIDSFLRGDYDPGFADGAPAPNPLLTPQHVISSVLHSLRQLDYPEPSHGAAVLLRFCVPLSRGERWGDSSSSNKNQASSNCWKEVMRGAITPTMLARRLRASELACLLDWTNIDVTEGAYSVQRDDGLEIGVPSSTALAFVNAALYFEEGVEPTLVQFTLRKINNVWLIDSAHISQKKLFVDGEGK